MTSVVGSPLAHPLQRKVKPFPCGKNIVAIQPSHIGGLRYDADSPFSMTRTRPAAWFGDVIAFEPVASPQLSFLSDGAVWETYVAYSGGVPLVPTPLPPIDPTNPYMLASAGTTFNGIGPMPPDPGKKIHVHVYAYGHIYCEHTLENVIFLEQECVVEGPLFYAADGPIPGTETDDRPGSVLVRGTSDDIGKSQSAFLHYHVPDVTPGHLLVAPDYWLIRGEETVIDGHWDFDLEVNYNYLSPDIPYIGKWVQAINVDTAAIHVSTTPGDPDTGHFTLTPSMTPGDYYMYLGDSDTGPWTFVGGPRQYPSGFEHTEDDPVARFLAWQQDAKIKINAPGPGQIGGTMEGGGNGWDWEGHIWGPFSEEINPTSFFFTLTYELVSP